MLPSAISLFRRLRGTHLVLLMALEETGSIRKAAEQIGLTQPAATKALKEVEETFGGQLFSRSTRGIVCNELGRLAIDYARRIHGEVQATHRELAHLWHGAGLRISIGTVAGAIPQIISTAVASIVAEYPQASLEIREGTSTDLLDLLDQKKLDVAIARVNISTHSECYEFVPLREEKLCIAASRHSSLRTVRDITLNDLQHCKWVVFPARLPMRSLLEQAFADAGEPFPTNIIETDSTFTALSILNRVPDSIAVLPDVVAENLANQELLYIVPYRIAHVATPYGVVTSKYRECSDITKAFIDICVQHTMNDIGLDAKRIEENSPDAVTCHIRSGDNPYPEPCVNSP